TRSCDSRTSQRSSGSTSRTRPSWCRRSDTSASTPTATRRSWRSCRRRPVPHNPDERQSPRPAPVAADRDAGGVTPEQRGDSAALLRGVVPPGSGYREPVALRRRREGRERCVGAVLSGFSAISILTTVGIVLVLVIEAASFFTHVSVIDFLFGTKWMPLFRP